MCHCFWSNVFMREPRPRSALLVLSLDTFKAVTRLPGLSTQVSSPERQGPAARVCNKTVNKHKNYTENVPHQTLTHRESRQVCFLVSGKISSQWFFVLNKSFIGIRQKWSPRRRLLSARLKKREIKSRSRNIRKQTKKICCKNSHQRIFFRKDFTPKTSMEEG